MDYFPSFLDIFFCSFSYTSPGVDWWICFLCFVLCFFFYFLNDVFFSCVCLLSPLYYILISVSSTSLCPYLSHFLSPSLLFVFSFPYTTSSFLVPPSYFRRALVLFLRIPLRLFTPPALPACFETTYSPMHFIIPDPLLSRLLFCYAQSSFRLCQTLTLYGLIFPAPSTSTFDPTPPSSCGRFLRWIKNLLSDLFIFGIWLLFVG